MNSQEMKKISQKVYEYLTSYYKKIKETKKFKGVGQTPACYEEECSICHEKVKLAFMVFNYQTKSFICIKCYLEYVNKNLSQQHANMHVSKENKKKYEYMMTGDPELDEFLKEYLIKAEEELNTNDMSEDIIDEINDDFYTNNEYLKTTNTNAIRIEKKKNKPNEGFKKQEIEKKVEIIFDKEYF